MVFFHAEDGMRFPLVTGVQTCTLPSSIQALPDDLQTAIILRELDGMSYEEIAQTMDCPVGTVRSRIFRARDAIGKKVGTLIR